MSSLSWVKTADNVVHFGALVRLTVDFDAPDGAIPTDDTMTDVLERFDEAIQDIEDACRRLAPTWSDGRTGWPGKRMTDGGIEDVSLHFTGIEYEFLDLDNEEESNG
jgi:hypothetical protein